MGDELHAFDACFRPIADEKGVVQFIVPSGFDITPRIRAEKRLQQTTDRLLFLSRRLLEILETERRQLARELHDEIGQALTAAKINLQTVQRYPEPDTIVERLDESIAVVDNALMQVRSMSLELRPPLLDDLGLDAALRWLAEQQSRRAGLRIELQGAATTRYPSEVETACFRVAQEALTNVVRHARARSVVMKLEAIGGMLHLRVKDDGGGFDVQAARRRGMTGDSLGLVGMEERAILVGGEIEWHSAPGATEVHAWFPLDREASA